MTGETQSTARQAALDRLDDLLELLRSQPASERSAELLEIAGHLRRAVEAFHMEGIRFRFFTLTRLSAQEVSGVPPRGHALLEEIGTALQGAGFRIK